MEGEIAYFELGVDDPTKARAFYGELFGWTFTPRPSGQGFAISTPSLPGGVHGGEAGARPYLFFVAFFVVDDMETALAKVRELGGTVDETNGETDSASQATLGRFVLCKDDQGFEFGLHQRPSLMP